MSDNTLVATACASFAAQPGDVRGLSESERDALIISAIQVDGQWVILSRYGDTTWQLVGFTSNVEMSKKRLDFSTVPPAFRVVMKAMFYRYLRRGRGKGVRPKGGSMKNLFLFALPFLRHLEALKLDHINAVTPMVCGTYVNTCKAYRKTIRSKGKPFSQVGMESRFQAVEAIHELSQYTDDRMPMHPWPETSAKALAGRTGRGLKRQQQNTTHSR